MQSSFAHSQRVVRSVAGQPGIGTGEKGQSDGVGSEAAFGYPRGMTFDSHWNIILADTENHQIRWP